MSNRIVQASSAFFLPIYKGRLFLLCLFLIGINNISSSQSIHTVDSLVTLLNTIKGDTAKVDLLNLISANLYQVNLDKAEKYSKEALILSEKIDYKKGTGAASNFLGIINKEKGDYQQAIEYYFKALHIAEELNFVNGIKSCNSNIGLLYLELNNYEDALKYLNKALIINEKIKDSLGIGNAYNNIGAVFNQQGESNKALEYYSKALEIRENIKDSLGLPESFNNMGMVYFNLSNYADALIWFQKAIHTNQKLNIITDPLPYINIANIYLKQKKYADVPALLDRALEISIKLKKKKITEEIYKSYAEYFKSIGNDKKALEYYMLYTETKDSLLSENNIKKTYQLQLQYEFDKKEAIAKIEQERKDALALKEKQQQQAIVYITSGGLLVFLLLSVFIYRGYSHKKKLSLNLAHKNQEITDSINYAKRIQEAILPTEDEFKTAFPDSFILFKPKDIVSGDFYWISTNPKEFPSIDKEYGSNSWRVKNPLVAAVDCTGHGVPGSLMSMMGNSLLNKIVDTHKISNPNEILNLLRTEIINSLKQHGENENKDGMDIALCTVYDDKIEFAGANNPIYIIRKNGNLEEIKADKMPVGYSGVELKPYTNHSVKMELGDSFYIFTDGYADQFGGKDNKKFKYKQLKDLLVTINSKSMESQKEILNETIENWKGTNEQTDDILVIGIRI
ncbi:MAG: tetratricopeptide repeat protein [Flavobacteriales bacterium]|nr:tetratricopeptide repeat protein [Flavobacteriales bacterium]